MSIEKAVEAIIKEANEQGNFNYTKGKGKTIDFDTYCEPSEKLRLPYSVLKKWRDSPSRGRIITGNPSS